MPGGSASSVVLPGGISMPSVGLGTFMASDSDLKRAVLTALDAGYRSIDTAMSYGNEAAIGEALSEAFAKGKCSRKDVFITTKVPGAYLGSKQTIQRALQKSLTALKVEYVDLYLIHAPVGYELNSKEELFPKGDDGEMLYAEHDIVKAWQVLEEFVNDGLVRAIGVSNFNSKQIKKVLDVATIPIATNQVECHVYMQQQQLRQFCREKGIVVTAFAPLGSPAWTGPQIAEKNLPMLMDDSTANTIAQKHKKTVPQVLLRYLVEEGDIVIPKSINPRRIKENIDIFDFSLDEDDSAILKTLDKKLRYFDMLQIMEGHPEYPFLEPF